VRRGGEGVEVDRHVDADATRRQVLPAPEAAHRSRHRRRTEVDVTAELRPGGERLVDLGHGRRHPARQLARLEEAQDVRHLVGGRQAGQLARADVAEEAVEERALGLEVEALDVEQPTVTRLHQHRHPGPAGRLPHQELEVERVALLHHDVEPVEEGVDVACVEPRVEGLDVHVGVQLGDAPAEDRGLVQPQVEDRRRDPVEVGQLQVVEVGEAQLGADALEGEDVGDAVADAEPHHPDLLAAEAVLLGRGDLVAVAVEAQGPERAGAEEAHEGPSPRVVDPHRGSPARRSSTVGTTLRRPVRCCSSWSRTSTAGSASSSSMRAESPRSSGSRSSARHAGPVWATTGRGPGTTAGRVTTGAAVPSSDRSATMRAHWAAEQRSSVRPASHHMSTVR
jgi:hypothetical protein